MKTVEEILNEEFSKIDVIPKDCFADFILEAIYDSMKKHTREAIKADRENIAEHITLKAYYEPEEWDNLKEELENGNLEEEGYYHFPYLSGGKVLFLDKDSIINAPQIELK